MVVGTKVLHGGYGHTKAQPLLTAPGAHLLGGAMEVSPKIVQDVALATQELPNLFALLRSGVEIESAELVHGIIQVTPRALPSLGHGLAQGLVLLFVAVCTGRCLGRLQQLA